MNVTEIVIGVAVVILLLARQVQKRSVKEDSRPLIFLVLAVVGLFEAGQYIKAHPVNNEAILLSVASLVLAAVFGVIRAYTVRLWREDGQLFRQGNALTIVLWIVAIGIHLGGDMLIDSSAKGLSTTTLLLYLAVTLGVQQMVVRYRAGQLSRV
ncbi:MAG TPA: hypothetical protein VG247_13510 [Pseudonocardiaceae bacterium]|nr:hypothetical protein [Pseudonocardiaceae bacterium]